MWGYYNLSEITTDEMLVPTRGSDWFDNGRWLEIHRQTWTANSGSALDDMNGTWNDLFSGVARANLMIDVIEKAGGAATAAPLAELRTLRAFYYYMLQDFFVTFKTTHEAVRARALADRAIAGFAVNRARLAEALDRNPILVTALNPVIGYEKGALIAKTAYQQGRPIREVAAEMSDLSKSELDRLLDPAELTTGGIKDKSASGG